MATFDTTDTERRQPSAVTPRCPHCDEAGLPRYGGSCFRHALATLTPELAVPAV